MVQTVKLEDGSTHSFPDDATPEEMNRALSSLEKPADDQSFLSKLPRNILTGLADMGHGIINAPHNIANLISPKLASHIPEQQDYDYASLLKLPKATTADKVIRGIAQYTPAMVMPAAEMGVAGEAAGILPRMAAQAAPQAAFGATQDKNPLAGAAEGAAAGSIGELGSSGIEALINKLRPSSLLRGNLSKEELQSNLNSTQGTSSSLGRVIGSPSLNRIYENILPHVIGSGAEDTMQKTANQITTKGSGLLDALKGNSNPDDLSFKLQNALKKAANDAKQEKNEGFKKLNDLADNVGLNVGRTNLQSTANDFLNEIKQSPELKGEFNSSLLGDLQRYASNSNGNNLKLTNIFRSKLGDKANDFYQNGQMYEYGIANSLKQALSKDIDSSFSESGNKELKKAYEQNQEDYAQKFAPFEDKDIIKFTRQGGDSDLLLSHFLRGGKNDRANLLDKLVSKMSDKDKNLVPYSYFSKALDENGQVDPIKIASLYKNLGKNQKDVLFNDKDLKNSFDDYSDLVQKNKESFDLMRNPKTGARNTDLLIKLSQLLAGTAAGGIPGLAATTIGSGLLGRGATKALTSEKLRQNLINAMINSQKINIPGRSVVSGSLNDAINSYSNNNQGAR